MENINPLDILNDFKNGKLTKFSLMTNNKYNRNISFSLFSPINSVSHRGAPC